MPVARAAAWNSASHRPRSRRSTVDDLRERPGSRCWSTQAPVGTTYGSSAGVSVSIESFYHGLVRRRGKLSIAVAIAGLVVAGPYLWTEAGSIGHEYGEADAPVADVALVLGTEVLAGGQPSNRLAGRLATAAALVRTGKAKAILVSGDGHGVSGDEPAAMAAYLTGTLGVDAKRVVRDPYGLDTYDSCVRARDVYGVKRALVVTQTYHVSRAVTLCRNVGLDVDGVDARCDGCSTWLLVSKWGRDFFADWKAAWDALSGRSPAVVSPADPRVREALG
jgi:vancomycin permeability regulator SanA